MGKLPPPHQYRSNRPCRPRKTHRRQSCRHSGRRRAILTGSKPSDCPTTGPTPSPTESQRPAPAAGPPEPEGATRSSGGWSKTGVPDCIRPVWGFSWWFDSGVPPGHSRHWERPAVGRRPPSTGDTYSAGEPAGPPSGEVTDPGRTTAPVVRRMIERPAVSDEVVHSHIGHHVMQTPIRSPFDEHPVQPHLDRRAKAECVPLPLVLPNGTSRADRLCPRWEGTRPTTRTTPTRWFSLTAMLLFLGPSWPPTSAGIVRRTRRTSRRSARSPCGPPRVGYSSSRPAGGCSTAGPASGSGAGTPGRPRRG